MESIDEKISRLQADYNRVYGSEGDSRLAKLKRKELMTAKKEKMEMKFKEGDYVIITDDEDENRNFGNIGKITGIIHPTKERNARGDFRIFYVIKFSDNGEQLSYIDSQFEKSPSEFKKGNKIKSHLQQGTQVELEHKHTIEKIKNNPNISVEKAAELIAKDHLKEDPKYYEKLKVMEMEKGNSFKVNPKYSYFAISKRTNKIVDGWEIVDDVESLKYYAKIDLKDNYPDNKVSDFKILSAKELKSKNIDPYNWDNWRKTGGSMATGKKISDKIFRNDLVGKLYTERVGYSSLPELKVVHAIEFPASGDFGAHYKAVDYLKEMGYVIGSMEGPNPIGFSSKYNRISKWGNMSRPEHELLDGAIISTTDSPRNGNAIILFFSAPAYKKGDKLIAKSYAQEVKAFEKNIKSDYGTGSAELVWNNWDKSQRKHFLSDHFSNEDGLTRYGKQINAEDSIELKWEYLNSIIKNEVRNHVIEGRYEQGDKVGKKEWEKNIHDLREMPSVNKINIKSFGIEIIPYNAETEAYTLPINLTGADLLSLYILYRNQYDVKQEIEQTAKNTIDYLMK